MADGALQQTYTDTSIVVNRFKNVGIIEAAKKARETSVCDENSENLPPPEVDEAPLTAILKLKIAAFLATSLKHSYYWFYH